MQLSSQVKKTRLPNTRKYEGRASTRIPSLNRDLLFSIIVIYYFVGFDFAGGDPIAIVTNSSGNTFWQAFVVLALGNGFLLAAYFRTKPLWRGLWPFIPMICWIT